MWEKKKELDNLNISFQNGQQKKEEKRMQISALQNSIENYQTMWKRQEGESKKREETKKRQMNAFNKILRDNHIDKNLDNSDIGIEIKLKNEKVKNDFLKRSISILASEIDEVKNILSNEMQDLKIPSRPISVKTEMSNVSKHSQEESKQLSEA